MRQGEDTTVMEALNKGEIVSNAAELKTTGITANKIAIILSLFLAALKAFDIDIPAIDDDTLIMISGGVAALLLWMNNIIATVTSRKIGK